MSRHDHLGRSAFQALVGLSGFGIVLYFCFATGWRPNIGPMVLFAALSFLLKRSGFHAAPQVTHSLMGLVDVAAILSFGPLGGALVSGVSGFAYLALRSLRRGSRTWQNLLLRPLFDGGLKAWMAWGAGAIYQVLGGSIPLVQLGWSDAFPLAVLFAMWFLIDHLGWTLYIGLQAGWTGMGSFLRQVLPLSVLVELLPLPLSIPLAVLYDREEAGLFGLLAAGMLAASVIVQRLSDVQTALVHRLRELIVLDKIGWDFARARLNVDELTALMYQYCAQIVDVSSSFSIGLLSDGGNTLRHIAWDQQGQRQPAVEMPVTPGVRWMQRERRPLLVRDMEREDLPFEPTVIGKPMRSAVMLPLLAGEELVGVVSVQHEIPNAYDEDDMRTLSVLAAQGALAFQKAIMYEEEQRRTRQMAAITRVTQQVAAVLELDALFSEVVRGIRDTFGYYHVAIFTIDPRTNALEFKASTCEPDRSCNFSAKTGEGIIGWVAESGEPLLANDVTREPRYRLDDLLEETRSELAVPLLAEGENLGVLDIQSDQLNAFTEADLATMQTVASQVAIAIQQARLYDAERKRTQQLNAVREVGRRIVSILELDELLHQVVQLVSVTFSDLHVHVFIADPESRELVYRAGTRAAETLATELRFPWDGDGIIAQVAREGEPMTVNDVLQEPRYLREPVLGPIRSELAIPLKFGRNILGVFDLQSESANAFDRDDLAVFRALSDQIAVAIRNAMLYASEKQKRQQADTLRDVSTALSSTLDTDELLRLILDGLKQVVAYEMTALLLVDNGRARLAASESLPEEVRDTLAAGVPVDDERLKGLLRHGEPEICEAPSETLLFNHLGDRLQGYSCLGVPLHMGEGSQGALIVMRSAEAPFRQEDANLALTFANQASLALQNARLFASQQEEAWVSTVLLQVAEALGRQTTESEVVGAIVRLVPLLVGVERCAVFLVDQETGDLVLAGEYLAEGEPTRSSEIRLGLAEAPLLERLVATGSPIIVPDEDLPNVLPTELMTSLKMRRVAAFPMAARGNLLGCMLVGFSDAAWPVPSKPLAIATGIAHETATAIESAQLYNALQEEAYVSTALLQVAESIGTAVDLDEALEAVVRITPILVGVDRCTIFLWDEERSSFMPARQYGVPKELAPEFHQLAFQAGDFPLLDQLRDRREPVVVSDAMASELVPKGLADKFGIRSLVALPLYTRGEILGAMLVDFEERLRTLPDKRKSILTGIAGQTAMAIETARLYGEMLTRQRLEQELAVARSIQKSFLPQSCPYLPGWQVSALWRSARQVGGDFYDIIQLDGDRVGFLIADVSDKGVPAALYMALSKTLLRAAIAEGLSPAAVLAKANDLLVADSTSGMFVTVFFGVLDTRAGRFVYANAGHNLPILSASSGGTRLLGAEGMILGVLEGIALEEVEVSIGHGDVLLMYTDGITDAINGQEEEFGMERLVELVRERMGESAENLIRRIDDAVAEYVGQQPQFDDFTLLAVKRVGKGDE